MVSLRFLATAALCLAPASCASLKVHEKASAPRDWHLVGPADDAATVQLTIALAQPGLAELKRRLAVISDIESPDFGLHLSKAQARSYQKPEESAVKAVSQWLTKGGAEDVQVNSAYVYFNADVKTANSLLGCNLSEYQSPQGRQAYRATEYSLPSDLARYIRFVYPVTQFIEMPSKRRAVAESAEDLSILRRQASCKKADPGPGNAC